MVKRQPGRPTEDEFIGAASRFTTDNYQKVSDYLLNSPVAHSISAGKGYDIDIIRREWRAEGMAGSPETLEEFAVRQLQWYLSHKNRPGQTS